MLVHLRRPLDLPSTRINLDAGIGMAVFPEHGSDADTLLRRADIALHDAKQHQHGVQLYVPDRMRCTCANCS